MNVFITSGSASVQFLCRCLSLLAVALIVVSSYASFLIQSITFIMVGDAVVEWGMMQPSQTDFGEKDEDTWCSRPLKLIRTLC